MWLLIFPLLGALYLVVMLSVIMFKAFVVLWYCLAAVAAWAIRGGTKVVIRYTA